MTPFEKAERAKQLLADPLLKEALQNIREGLVRKAEASAFDDIDAHHQVVLSLQILKQVSVELQKYISEGVVVAHRVKQDSFIEKMRERFA